MDSPSLVSPSTSVRLGAATESRRRRRRRVWLAVTLFSLLPVSALVAFLVLQAMAGAFADPTGGCGGG